MVLYVKVCMNVYVSVKASNCFMHCAQNAGGGRLNGMKLDLAHLIALLFCLADPL